MKELIKSPVFTIVSFFVLLFLYSTFGPRLPISIITQQKGEPLLVTEQGKATAIPDIAKISIGIEENGTSLKLVQDNVNKISKDLISELKKLGIPEKDIKTTLYNLYPEYNYEFQPPRISGYRLSVNYEVKVEDFDKLNEVIIKATETGANIIDNISFDLKEETKQKALNEARKEAIEKAQEKAKSLAKTAGISLGKIINISESQNNLPSMPIYRKEAMDLSESITEPEIIAGETEITVDISISWEIK